MQDQSFTGVSVVPASCLCLPRRSARPSLLVLHAPPSACSPCCLELLLPCCSSLPPSVAFCWIVCSVLSRSCECSARVVAWLRPARFQRCRCQSRSICAHAAISSRLAHACGGRTNTLLTRVRGQISGQISDEKGRTNYAIRVEKQIGS